MGKKARINVQRFAEDVIMQQWIQLFNNLIKRNKTMKTDSPYDRGDIHINKMTKCWR